VSSAEPPPRGRSPHLGDVDEADSRDEHAMLEPADRSDDESTSADRTDDDRTSMARGGAPHDDDPSKDDSEASKDDGRSKSKDDDDDSKGSTVGRGIRRGLLLLLTLLVFNYLVLPQLAGARKAAETLSHVTWWLLIVAFAMEIAAMASYTRLTMAALPGDRHHRPIKFFSLFRIQLAVKSVTNLVPGGSATGSAMGYRLLVQAGVPGSDSAFAMATVGLGSAVVLNLVLWVALLVSLPRSGFQPAYATAAIAGAIAIMLVAALVVLLMKGQGPLDRIVRAIARKVPKMTPDGASDVLAQVVTHLRELAARPDVIRRGIAWAAANWMFDAGALWVFLAAFGQRVQIDSLLVAFGIANVLAVIPITPGGLGVVEAVLTSTLVGFGVPSGPAAVSVVTYRIAQFWLPIPLGAASYVSLKFGPTRLDSTSRRERMRELASEAFDPPSH
jgi:uncharacterized protein (TIRG00374 family)